MALIGTEGLGDCMATAAVNGITLGYDDQGGGTDALVLMHGHPFDRTMWTPQRGEFARWGWRVVVPDLRGYGESEVVPGVTPLETLARDVAELLDRLGLDRVVIGGLSMGGQTAMEFFRLFPERVRAMIVAGASPVADTEDGRTARRAMADRLLDEGMAGYADEVLAKMLAPYNVEALPDVAAHVSRMMRGTAPQGAAAALRGRAERPDYREPLSRASVPVLVVVGEDDEFTPVAGAHRLAEEVPGAQLAVVKGAGHMPNLEQPEEFNRVVLRFLEGVRGAVHDRRAS